MTENELLAIVEEQESLASSGELMDERATAIDLYMGRPYGDEIEGRSQVVMRDVADTIEWIKPSLLKVFAAGDDIVSFVPRGPEDEEQAQQETDYCNYLLMQKNNGFMILHDWFHDALLQKNGYVILSYEEYEHPETETYRNLSPEEASLVLQDAELVEGTANEDGTSDLKVKKTYSGGCIRVRNIPPERVLVSANCPSVDVQESEFVEVIELTTISKLREAGFDVPDDISDNGRDDYEEVSFKRRLDDQYREIEETGDPTTRTIRCRRIWIRIDFDGDGVAELRRVVIVGQTVLENEPDDIIPVAAITAIRAPHEHTGMSITDIVQDLQRIRTALTRGFLDNMYLANNGRFAIDASTVNIDDMLNSRPGGVVRVTGNPSGAFFPLVQPQNGGAIIQAIEYVDSVRENRTGVTRYNQGIDANSLNKTASGITQIMNASQQRIELIARIFAETGVRTLMRLLQGMSIKYGRYQEIVKLRNKWIPVNPSEWKKRTDLTVSVGLGVGNKDQNLLHLQNILVAQKEAAQIGLATPKNIYNALVKMTQNAGFKNVDDFWTDPESAEPKPEQIPPEVQKEQMKIQADAQKFQAQTQNDIQKAQFEAQQAELDRQAETARAIEVERIKQEAETQREIIRAQASAQPQIAVQADASVAEALNQGNMASMQGNAMIGDAIKQMSEAITMMANGLAATAAAQSAPKAVIRGEDGRIVGVQPVGM